MARPTGVNHPEDGAIGGLFQRHTHTESSFWPKGWSPDIWTPSIGPAGLCHDDKIWDTPFTANFPKGADAGSAPSTSSPLTEGQFATPPWITPGQVGYGDDQFWAEPQETVPAVPLSEPLISSSGEYPDLPPYDFFFDTVHTGSEPAPVSIDDVVWDPAEKSSLPPKTITTRNLNQVSTASRTGPADEMVKDGGRSHMRKRRSAGTQGPGMSSASKVREQTGLLAKLDACRDRHRASLSEHLLGLGTFRDRHPAWSDPQPDQTSVLAAHDEDM